MEDHKNERVIILKQTTKLWLILSSSDEKTQKVVSSLCDLGYNFKWTSSIFFGYNGFLVLYKNAPLHPTTFLINVPYTRNIAEEIEVAYIDIDAKERIEAWIDMSKVSEVVYI